MERLDAVLGGFRSNPERRLAYDESMLERCAPSLALCVDSEANGSELHLGDRVVSVAALGCGRQSHQVCGHILLPLVDILTPKGSQDLGVLQRIAHGPIRRTGCGGNRLLRKPLFQQGADDILRFDSSFEVGHCIAIKTAERSERRSGRADSQGACRDQCAANGVRRSLSE